MLTFVKCSICGTFSDVISHKEVVINKTNKQSKAEELDVNCLLMVQNI